MGGDLCRRSELPADVRLDLGALAADIAEAQGRIKEAFYANLFLMLAESDRREITAREIDERREEKMLMLGPVLERLHDELLQPLVARVFRIMARNGLIPRPPKGVATTACNRVHLDPRPGAKGSRHRRHRAFPTAISFGIDHRPSLAVENQGRAGRGLSQPVLSPNSGGAMHTSTRRTSMSACPASTSLPSCPWPANSEWPS